MSNHEPKDSGAAAAIAVARKSKRSINPDEPVVLSTGIKAKIVGVSPALVDDATSQIKDPPVPKEMDENKGREIENPYHPDYLKAVEKANQQRGIASMDVMVMFGVELVDPVPPKEEWYPKMLLMHRLGRLQGFNPDIYNMEDPMEVEFVYKRYFAISGADLVLISERSGMDAEALQAAEKSF